MRPRRCRQPCSPSCGCCRPRASTAISCSPSCWPATARLLSVSGQRNFSRSGAGRLLERLRSEELLPLGSRMRVRLALERTGPEELQEYVVHALQKAGAVTLMPPELIATLCDHAQGTPRALMNIAGELLAVAAEREARQIDEKLFLETCTTPPVAEPKTAGRRR